MMIEPSIWVMGGLLGLRHALEPDHLTAVSVLAAEERSPRATLALGAAWGIGHTAALLVVSIVLAALDATMPERVANGFELFVALMLIILGTRSIVRAARDVKPGQGILGWHEHGSTNHLHLSPVGGHVHLGRWTFARRSLIVGVVHGLAGSGSLTALVAAHIASTPVRLLYVGLFGLGSVVGMALLSGVLGWPLARLGQRPAFSRRLTYATGLFAICFGVRWGWPLVAGFLR